MTSINGYHTDSVIRNFAGLDEKFAQQYDVMCHQMPPKITPRAMLTQGLKVGFRDILYYISWIYDNNPASVLDIGCGENVWKDWFPNIIGLDPDEWEYASYPVDILEKFDEKFSLANVNKFDAAMALNSLHFIHWEMLPHQITYAMNVVKPTGRCLFTINFHILDRFPPRDDAALWATDKKQYLLNVLEALDYTIILLDFVNNQGIITAINGDARFILEKTQ